MSSNIAKCSVCISDLLRTVYMSWERLCYHTFLLLKNSCAMFCCECRELSSLRMELCYLAPLWELYQKLITNVSPGYCDVPSVVRALTELFYVAENLAMVSSLIACAMLVLLQWVSLYPMIYLLCIGYSEFPRILRYFFVQSFTPSLGVQLTLLLPH